MSTDHDHDHDHPHAPIEHHAAVSEWELLEIAVRELAIEKGMISADDHRRWLEYLDAAGPALGARVVARAWVDPAYKARLLDNASAACEELGIVMYDNTKGNLLVMENTAMVHNLVVCTLCSCYPRPVLGLPPDWYKSAAYRKRAVRWPRALLAEFGTISPEDVAIRVHDSTADMRYLVLPMRPAGTEGWSEERLQELVTRDAMIGVTVPRVP